MSDEEKNYFYFKVHDLDGNDKLDGLEIFYSATHHSDSESSNDEHHHHDHEQEEDSVPAIDNSQIDSTNEKSDSEILNSSVANPKLPKIEGKSEAENKNLNHIIGMFKFTKVTVSSALER